MYVNFYSLNKKINSTQRPGTYVKREDCKLKDPCNILRPIIRVTGFNYSENFKEINYAYINTFGRYYWITDKTIINNDIQQLTLEVDVLATYKTDIGNYQPYLKRSSNDNYIKEYAYDNLIKPQAKIRKTGQVIINTDFSLSNPMTVMGFSGAPAGGGGVGTTNFIKTGDKPENILAVVYNDNSLVRCINDHFGGWIKLGDSVILCKVFPFSFTTHETSSVYVGQWHINIDDAQSFDVNQFSTVLANSRRWAKTYTLTLPGNDSPYDDFRKYDGNWCKLILRVPFIGKIELPATILQYNKLDIVYCIDLITGIGEVNIKAWDPVDVETTSIYTVGTYNVTMGFDVPISNYSTNFPEIASNVLSGNAPGVVFDILQPPIDVNTITQASGMACFDIANITLDYIYYDTESIGYKSIKGRPAMTKLTDSQSISTVGGYVEVLDSNIEVDNATLSEKESINNYLNNGFYYE